MADLDGFKSINDTYGHSCGDEVLRVISDIFQQGCRAEDVVCRYGGEEFTILLPNTSVQSAGALAERLRAPSRPALSPTITLPLESRAVLAWRICASPLRLRSSSVPTPLFTMPSTLDEIA